MSPNMSVATNVAFKLLATMAKALGEEYDVEITEIHHRFKKDAPSGTALRMAEVVAAALGRDLDQGGVYGRQGLPGERAKPEIGILSLRGDHVAGPEGEDADLGLGALAGQALPAVDGDLIEIAPERGGHDLRHAERGAAGRVLLESVVDLGDLDVVLFAERLGHGGQELERDVGGDGHVGRHQDRRSRRAAPG